MEPELFILSNSYISFKECSLLTYKIFPKISKLKPQQSPTDAI